MSTNPDNSVKRGMFVTADGKNVAFTFAIVSSLFLLWGFGNGMIDVMDKHFQDELHLTLSQSANVQWAHYLGYFLMSLPAGWLAGKLGYKGGIIVGLLMVAAGGLWFIPATQIAQFWAFLVGVCFIASGFTFLETIANPYTTVLGDPRFAASRINLAQSCNGIGWILGPIAGSMFFYSKNDLGQSTGSETLWIPYAMIAAVVAVLAVVFYFADVPDIKAEDDYHLDDAAATGASRSIWTHPHFIFAIVAQFLYVAAQAGIFSFFINYMTAEIPSVPRSWHKEGWVEVRTKLAKDDVTNLPQLVERLQKKADPVSAFLYKHLSEETRKALADYKQGQDSRGLLTILIQDINNVVRQDPNKIQRDGPNAGQRVEVLATPERFQGAALTERARALLKKHAAEMAALDATLKEGAKKGETKVSSKAAKTPADRVDLPVLHRLLLTESYAGILRFDENIYAVSDSCASWLASFGFICFLIGRFSGAALLKVFSAHKVLGLYGVLNTLACIVVFLKVGWVSAVCVFLSYFFMSIMFPTIFALGIFGLGARAKTASAFIVMAIMGGAVLPKLMGHIADQYDMSRSFIIPTICFAIVGLYGICWPMLSGAKSLSAAKSTGGH